MPYTIGKRSIILSRTLSESDQNLVLSHTQVFRHCLHSAIIKYLITLKKIVHLYTDIMTIYSTLLKKIPQYDDVTMMTNRCKNSILQLEHDFNEVFGKNVLNEAVTINSNTTSTTSTISTTSTTSTTSFNVLDGGSFLPDKSFPSEKLKQWQEQSFEQSIKPSCDTILKSSIPVFDQIAKTLVCIDLFFSEFSNLKKLLIPLMRPQTTAVQQSLKRVNQTIQNRDYNVDHLSTTEFSLKLHREIISIEQLTSLIDRESTLLLHAFNTFNSALIRYTEILLGKAILKRDIDLGDCQLIKRRDVCYQASERVVSIPLTEDKSSYNTSMRALGKSLTYFVMALMMVVMFVVFRLINALFGGSNT